MKKLDEMKPFLKSLFVLLLGSFSIYLNVPISDHRSYNLGKGTFSFVCPLFVLLVIVGAFLFFLFGIFLLVCF